MGGAVVAVVESGECSGAILKNPGFILVADIESNATNFDQIIWTETSSDIVGTDYAICDLNKDGVNELLTIFHYDVTFWGYVHEFSFANSAESVILESARIPDSLIDRFGLFDSVTVDNSHFVLHGWSATSGSHTRLRIDCKEQSGDIRFELFQE